MKELAYDPSQPYPQDERCDWCLSRAAVLRVLDTRGYEKAVCCQECAPRFQVTFEDADGNVYNP